ncbi:peptidylprolyl isomerase [Paenibacillus polygoni]|uniref:Peptidylprolyl isomerase n=1 Tax=Paenibacillus polygoni TaxID=3050112 RepID=A0ABY8X4W1_9BACL|nr:peptidylprolyl isomerase [Paenibacillus polygoni]WIV19283.1 peptidylprolyl isomerase [Paenibacillus polygoni]
MLRSNKKSWKTIAVTMVGVLSISLLAACGNGDDQNSASDDKSAIIVKYDGGEITENEFNTEMKIMKFMSPQYAQLMEMDEFREYLVEQQVTYEYLSNQASEESKKQGEEEADNQLAQMKEQVGDEQWKAMLENYELTEADIKNYMARVLTIVKDKSPKVTEEELKAQYDASPEQFITATVRHVLISFQDPETQEERAEGEALKIAKEVKAKLDKGEDFAAVAKKYSEDPGSAENGGLYEDTPIVSWVEAFKEAAKTLEINKISDPVETDYGYHIIKVEKRTEPTFEELTQEQKDTLANTIVNTQIQTFMEKELDGIMKGEIKLPANPAAEKEGTDTEGTGTEGTQSETPEGSDTGTEGTDKGTDQGTTGTEGTDAGKESTDKTTDGK